MGNRGKREFIQVLRLLEIAAREVVAAAVADAIHLGAIGYVSTAGQNQASVAA